ncbi:hypothetical protein KFE25_012540 [Diacronema lutheri]|uniref:Uncharacterized protein n=1 Tax=Diacronema lutheri TaxID=2081491 RepID=A0A8J5XJ14_DIALT|nr:hypothetical protein KFE25_012540 [Diacronema lutheri]
MDAPVSPSSAGADARSAVARPASPARSTPRQRASRRSAARCEPRDGEPHHVDKAAAALASFLAGRGHGLPPRRWDDARLREQIALIGPRAAAVRARYRLPDARTALPFARARRAAGLTVAGSAAGAPDGGGGGAPDAGVAPRGSPGGVRSADDLRQLSLTLSRVDGAEAFTAALAACADARVAQLMAGVVAAELEQSGGGHESRALLLALSSLVNLAAMGGHAQLLAPSVNALDLFVTLLADSSMAACSALSYAVAGVRNLANHRAAANALRLGPGEQLLRDLLAPARLHPLDVATHEHASAALVHIAHLATVDAAAAISRVRSHAEERAAGGAAALSAQARAHSKRLAARLHHESAQQQRRARAARTIGLRARAWLLARRLRQQMRQEQLDRAMHAALRRLALTASVAGAGGVDERAAAALQLAQHCANASLARLAELAPHAPRLVELTLCAPDGSAALKASGATIAANLACAPDGHRALVHAGAVGALIGALHAIDAGRDSDPHAAACAAQCCAALQNLACDSREVSDELLLHADGKRPLHRLMKGSSEAAGFAAGALSNAKLYATRGALDASGEAGGGGGARSTAGSPMRASPRAPPTPAERRARHVPPVEQHRALSARVLAATRIQAACRGMHARALARAKRRTEPRTMADGGRSRVRLGRAHRPLLITEPVLSIRRRSHRRIRPLPMRTLMPAVPPPSMMPSMLAQCSGNGNCANGAPEPTEPGALPVTPASNRATHAVEAARALRGDAGSSPRARDSAALSPPRAAAARPAVPLPRVASAAPARDANSMPTRFGQASGLPPSPLPLASFLPPVTHSHGKPAPNGTDCAGFDGSSVVRLLELGALHPKLRAALDGVAVGAHGATGACARVVRGAAPSVQVGRGVRMPGKPR